MFSAVHPTTDISRVLRRRSTRHCADQAACLKVSPFLAATFLVLVAFDGHALSPSPLPSHTTSAIRSARLALATQIVPTTARLKGSARPNRRHYRGCVR